MRRSFGGPTGAIPGLVRSRLALIPALLLAVVSPLAAAAIVPASARAGELYIYQCAYADSQRSVQNSAPAFTGNAGGQYWNTPDECPSRSLEINTTAQLVAYGHSSDWSTTTPSEAIKINTVYIPAGDVLTDCTLGGDGYAATFFWGDDGQNYGTKRIFSSGGPCTSEGVNNGTTIDIPIGGMTLSRYFGWTVACGDGSGCKRPSPDGALVGVHGIGLGAVENTGPALLAVGAGNLYYQNGRYVRGDGWDADVQATDPSGVCDESATVDGQALATVGPIPKNQSEWLQCGSGTTSLAATANTTGWTNGAHTLTLSATNAAGVPSSASSTVTVDNAPVTLSMSGPTDAPVTSGTQYVRASASAGVSGVAGIACSTDGSPYRWYPEGSVQIPVQGLGGHVVSCYAQNRAVDPSGRPATSAVSTWHTSIRYPTVISASFGHTVDTLRCRTARKRVRVPARWVTVRRHGKPVRVRRRAHTKNVKVRSCHPRIVRRRERVKGGHWRVVRVPVFPHVVEKTTLRVAHGHGATISGWLGETDGTALGGQSVRILTAPNNGRHRFAKATVATTSSNGIWTARLRPGPSRLVEAVYDGGTVDEPAISPPAHLVVPARIRLHITPRWVAWSGKITLSGRLMGGYVPHDGVALRLRVGYPGGAATLHALRTNSHGAFRFSWSFGAGNGIVTWPVWIATVSNETDYPYAASRSVRIPIKFGGEPPPPRRRRR